MFTFDGKGGIDVVQRKETTNPFHALASWFETHPRVKTSIGIGVVLLAMASLILVGNGTSKFTGK